MPNDANVISTIVQSYQKIDSPSETAIKTDKVPDLVDKPNNNIEPPITEYKEIKGIPYAVKYFNLDYWNELSSLKNFQSSTIHKNVMKIDSYINEKIVNDDLKNDKSSYQSIMANLKGFVGAKENELPEKIIKRVSAYIDILKRQAELDHKKELLYGQFPNRKNPAGVA